jgi:phosphatidylserine decarboxylase
MWFITVGLREVLTCEVTVNEGDLVKRGEQSGMFYLGGFSDTLVFHARMNITFLMV